MGKTGKYSAKYWEKLLKMNRNLST